MGMRNVMLAFRAAAPEGRAEAAATSRESHIDWGVTFLPIWGLANRYE